MRQCVSWSPSGRGRVGTEIRHSPAFTAAEEQALWAKDVLGCTNPKNLQHAVSFILVSDSVLEGVRNSGYWGLLSLCALMTQIAPHNYIEHGSKNRSGGLAQLHLENKCVPCYICCS